MIELMMIAAALGGAEANQPQDRTAGVEIAAVRAQLWYQHSGRLSADIAPPAEFVLWNTIIGEGDAEEPAEDMLVTVEVRSSTPNEAVSASLRIEVRNREGRVLAQRQVEGFSTSQEGRAVHALLVPNVGCAGEVRINARLGSLQRSTSINFECGE